MRSDKVATAKPRPFACASCGRDRGVLTCSDCGLYVCSECSAPFESLMQVKHKQCPEEKVSDGQTIEVLYTCALCGLIKVRVQVPTRGEEDVKAWMDQTAMHLASDHERRSPRCHPKVFTMVMIPVDGSTKVGGPIIQ